MSMHTHVSCALALALLREHARAHTHNPHKRARMVEGTHHIQGGDTHNLALVVHPHGLQGLSRNGDGGVHRIGDDVQDSLSMTTCTHSRSHEWAAREHSRRCRFHWSLFGIWVTHGPAGDQRCPSHTFIGASPAKHEMKGALFASSTVPGAQHGKRTGGA